MSSEIRDHPANIWNKARHHAFAHYEKYGDPDQTINYIISRYRLEPRLQAGIKAEILAYHEFKSSFQLEPLLDAGVKADLTGIKDGRMTNFDVTSNIGYKNINDYSDVIVKRGKPYEIILYRDDLFEFFPLRFPRCNDCGYFSHYILFLSPPDSKVFWHASETQVLVEYCPRCENYDEIEYHSYLMDSFNVITRELEADQLHVETRIPQEEMNQIIHHMAVNTVQCYEKLSGLLISAISEGDYLVTNPQTLDGYHGGRVYWTHPLADQFIENEIDYYY